MPTTLFNFAGRRKATGILGWLETAIIAVLIAYGAPCSARAIRLMLEDRLDDDYPVSTAALYAALDRLELKALILSVECGPTGEPGGRSKREFEVTPQGRAIAAKLQRGSEKLWRGIRAGSKVPDDPESQPGRKPKADSKVQVGQGVVLVTP